MPISQKVIYKKHVWADLVLSDIMSSTTGWKILECLATAFRDMIMIARQKLTSSDSLPRYHIFRTAVARHSRKSFNVISYIISLKTKGCEFAFYMCNSFCEMGNLETLVSESWLAKEKDVAKHYISSTSTLCAGLYYRICYRATILYHSTINSNNLSS